MFAARTTDTTAQDAADIHRSAYNAAFHELGLKWHWDTDHYESALPASQEKAHLLSYLQAHQGHLLKAYDAAFLVDADQFAPQLGGVFPQRAPGVRQPGV